MRENLLEFKLAWRVCEIRLSQGKAPSDRGTLSCSSGDRIPLRSLQVPLFDIQK